MQNPYEEQQTVLLGRIIGNVEKLNEAMLELNRALAEINAHNSNITVVTDMWTHYTRNVLFNLESTESLRPPT